MISKLFGLFLKTYNILKTFILSHSLAKIHIKCRKILVTERLGEFYFKRKRKDTFQLEMCHTALPERFELIDLLLSQVNNTFNLTQ
jgi:hypothetical protein